MLALSARALSARALRVLALSALALSALAGLPAQAAGAASTGVDTALVLAVDVSGSVDEHRFRLQMEGIAQALEDAAIQRAILGGPHGAILVAMVQWSDRPSLTVPWTRIGTVADARSLAMRIRTAARRPGEFTCAAAMLHFVQVKMLPSIPTRPERTVVDVSGDGKDNCNPTVPPAAERDALVRQEVTVNGLPILEGDEKDTLEAWYRANIAGGPASFVVPADGYRDFGRAIRQKFLTEVSRR
ncbi:tRNA delta(2)-isopentenylpyrophosphate transferase [Prosthecomicrobium hirschii]|nr:tRNA delta(2)-isopentenylpyrophosphate transferase [Prosthecomicrobium hirschii]